VDVRSEPIKIQIAIQGGGAKICALMAAMEAFQDAEKQETIKVTPYRGDLQVPLSAHCSPPGSNWGSYGRKRGTQA